MGYALVNPPVPGRNLKRFELPQDIAALRTAKGNIRSRRYDVVLDEVIPPPAKQVLVEVKAWELFPPFNQGQLDGALDQMRRDFVFQMTGAVPPSCRGSAGSFQTCRRRSAATAALLQE